MRHMRRCALHNIRARGWIVVGGQAQTRVVLRMAGRLSRLCLVNCLWERETRASFCFTPCVLGLEVQSMPPLQNTMQAKVKP